MLTNVAIKNAKIKNKFHQALGHNSFKIEAKEANPSTQIYKIIEEIKK